MTLETIERSSPEQPDAQPERLDLLRQLQRETLRLTLNSKSASDLRTALTELLQTYSKPVAVFYFQRDDQGELAAPLKLLDVDDDARSRRLEKQLSTSCRAACRAGETVVRRQSAPARTIVATPIALRGGDPEGLGVVFSSDLPAPQLLMLVQIIASHLVFWHATAESRFHESDARDATALVELLDSLALSNDLRQACYTLASELADHLHCKRVVIGWRSNGSGRCRLLAVSGVAQFDKRSLTALAIEAAMDEAVLLRDVTIWPGTGDQRPHATLAHKNLCSVADANVVVSTPLQIDEEAAVGAVILLDDGELDPAGTERFLRFAGPSLASSMQAAQRAQGGWATRLTVAAGNAWTTWKGKAAVAAALCLIAASMAVPLPYKVHCDCQIEPVTRRYVAAPFEGTLETSLVEPGDIVKKGDILARMDGREVRWKRASVAADQNQAVKKRDSAQATHDYAEQQIAQLEIERLGLELQLLDHRAENLEIRCPVDGIVASGDLERAEGAPLTIGQTLFEIAPLNSMIVEVAVPDSEIAHVAQGQTIDLRLDAYPGQDWQAEVTKIQPRSEIRDGENVFIAEAHSENSDGRLRPGMKGRARVETTIRPLGWILFHKPWEYVSKKLNW